MPSIHKVIGLTPPPNHVVHACTFRALSWEVLKSGGRSSEVQGWLILGCTDRWFSDGGEKGVVGDSAEKAKPFAWWNSTYLLWVKTALAPCCKYGSDGNVCSLDSAI